MATQGPKESSLKRATDQFNDRKTYYSFGDDGVTATIGASGRLLQMTRHFPGQKVGFCVDHQDMEQPFFVTDRISTLLSWATDPFPDRGIDPTIDSSTSRSWEEPPVAEYVNNRWPVFTRTRDDGAEVKIQYLASAGTIFQTYEFDYTDKSEGMGLPSLSVPSDLLIKDLDFINSDNEFNHAKPNDKSYTSSAKGECIIREHEIDAEKEKNTTVALFISSFDKKKCLKFGEDENNRYKIEWDDEASTNPKSRKKLTVTLTYTLERISQRSRPPTPRVTFDKVSNARYQFSPVHSDSPMPTNNLPKMTNNEHLDYFLRRNVEHILSVCSIPVTGNEDGEIPAIALTCGDLDGHRVATAASLQVERTY